jgi:hypothetical protein
MLSCVDWYAFTKDKCYKFTTFPGEQWVTQQGATEKDRALILHDVGAGVTGRKFKSGTSYGPACLVLASSPNEDNYKPFDNTHDPRYFIVPTWTKEEFVDARPW